MMGTMPPSVCTMTAVLVPGCVGQPWGGGADSNIFLAWPPVMRAMVLSLNTTP